VWCILCVVRWSPVKSKIIKQRSNIFKIDNVVSTKLSPEPQERSSKIELLTKGSVFGTLLLANMYRWELIGLLTTLFLCHIGTTSTLFGNESITFIKNSVIPTKYGTVNEVELCLKILSRNCLYSTSLNLIFSYIECPPRRAINIKQ